MAHTGRDFSGARDLQSLPTLDRLDVLGGLEQRFVRAGVEPSHAATHHLARELAPLQILTIDVGDLELAARRWRKRLGNVDNPAVVEIKSRHRVARFRCLGLFLEADDASRAIELRYAVPLGIGHRIREDRRTARCRRCALELRLQVVAIEYVVAEDERAAVAADE